MREVKSFCRFCMPFCGTKVTLDDNNQIVAVKGDKDDLMTSGYICFKGVQAPASYSAADRVLTPLKKQPDGTFLPIAFDQALDEIAEKLDQTIEKYGPESVGGYRGSGSLLNASATSMLPAFLGAIGSHKHFTTYTIDQSAKSVAMGRIGMWNAPRHPLHDSDVRMMFGVNPLVSLATSYFDMTNPTKRLKEARARGMKLIVIDPRRTETANYADVFLQPYPGEDPTIAAGLIRIILSEGWQDREFCQRFVADMGKLKTAVEPFTPGYVSQRAGIEEQDLVKAARLFAHECKRGGASTGTGPSMAPHSNLSEHLVETLNIICGRYMREGEKVPNPGVLRAKQPRKAQVTAAPRWWDHSYKSRIGGYGMLGDEMMSGILTDEILEPGEGQIRAFFAHGSNVANIIPDQRKTVKALKSLDLLVSIDPYMTETSQLADYIIPVKMGYEREDLTMFFYESLYAEPYARYTPAISDPPPGSALVDDWQVFWGLARRMGLELVYDGVKLDMEAEPTTDSLLAIVARHAPIPFNELKSLELGGVFDDKQQFVEAADDGHDDKFTLMPDDVMSEMAQVANESVDHGAYVSNGKIFTHRLASRRIRDVQNTCHRNVPAIRQRMPYNYAYLHPSELSLLGIVEGEKIEITSDTGSIPAEVKIDPDLKPGVVSITHGWGGLPDATDYDKDGSNTGLLISTDRDLEPINAMPRMSAVPVNISRYKSRL